MSDDQLSLAARVEEVRRGRGRGHRALRRLPGAVPHPAGPRRRLRALCQRERAAGAHRSRRPHAAHASTRAARSSRSPAREWDGAPLDPSRTFVTGIGAGTTYPDYKPAPFIVSAEHAGVDTVTVVTEGIFSYCGVKVKIDTDRHLGPETAPIRVKGEQVGHVTTAEYGSQMLSIGGVRHLTGGSKKEGTVTCDALLELCAGKAVEMTIDGGHAVIVQAGAAPIVDGRPEVRMRVGCGSATVGIFARQWLGHVDEVIVVDDHITGVLTEHQSGRVLDMPPAGIRVRGRTLDAGALLPGRQSRPRLGRHRHHRSAGDHPEDRPQGGLARPAPADDLDHRRGRALLRARREPAARAGRDAGRRARRGRAHRRELRALAVHGAVHGRRRRVAARRRHREPGAADALGRRAARRASPWAARRSTSGPAAASR